MHYFIQGALRRLESLALLLKQGVLEVNQVQVSSLFIIYKKLLHEKISSATS